MRKCSFFPANECIFAPLVLVMNSKRCIEKEGKDRSLLENCMAPNFSRECWRENYVESNCDENQKSASTYCSP